MRRSIEVVLAIAILALPCSARASLTWEADTSRGTGVFEGLEKSPGTIDVVSDPKGTYGQVYHYNIWDNADGSKDRCESRGHKLTSGTNMTLDRGNEYYIGWRSLWDPNVGAQSGKWVAVWQMHAYGGTGMGAPLVLRTLGEGILHLQNNVVGTNDHIWNVPMRRDAWNTFVIRTRLEPTTAGWVELWYNGVQQTFINGSTRYNCPTHEDDAGTYNKLKWGIYRTGSATGNWHAWMSRARIGTTYADVDPGGSGTTPTPTPTPTPVPGATATPTPTPVPGGGAGGTWEAEALSPAPSGASTAMQTDANATGGTWLALLADGAGDYVQLTTPSLAAGSYTVSLRYKAHPSRGILQASVDGVSVGATLDQYAATAGMAGRTFGTVIVGAGTHTIRLACTGRNAASAAYTLSADTLTLAGSGSATPTPTPVPAVTPTPTATPGATPTPTPGGGGVSFEAESVTVTNSGTGTSVQSDANCSGGKWLSLDAENTGSWFELTTPSIPAGTYTLRMSYKTNSNRGQLVMKVDGVQVGGTIDQYGSPSTYPTATFGTVTFGTTGTHALRMSVAGKSSSSTSYVLSADKVTFE